jgi:hypothetical protein
MVYLLELITDRHRRCKMNQQTLETKSALETEQNSKLTLETIMITEKNSVNNSATNFVDNSIYFTIIGEELLF